MAIPTSPDTMAARCVCPNCGFAFATADSTGGAAGSEAESTKADPAAQLQDAHRLILDLEAQVRILNQKTIAAVDRWADYEDELAKLRRQIHTPATPTTPATPASSLSSSPSSSLLLLPKTGRPLLPPPPPTPTSPTRPSFLSVGAASRITALLSPRMPKAAPKVMVPAVASSSRSRPPPVPPLPTPPPSATTKPAHETGKSGSRSNGSNGSKASNGSSGSSGHSHSASISSTASSAASTVSFDIDEEQARLRDALAREQALRRVAEGRLQDTNREIEELSVSLFEQANSMVANERRARAGLEARVAVLEQRDQDKRRRLERLEQAMERIDRVRRLLQQSERQQQQAAAAATSLAAAEPESPTAHQRPIETEPPASMQASFVSAAA